MKKIISIFLSILLLLFSACSEELEGEGSSLTVISYNVHNLFDALEDGREYSEFKRSGGWTQELYEGRLAAFQKLFKSTIYSQADMIILQEVESEEVLRALLDRGMRSRGFIFYGIIKDDNPISVGYISKINPISVSIHRVGEQRPLLCLEIVKRGMQFAIVSLHAKSNLGDDEENRKLRKELAQHINFLARYYGSVPLLIIGDFNTEPALDCSDMLCDAAIAPGRRIIESGSVPITGDPSLSSATVFYDPAYDQNMPLAADGSYYYSGKWYIYDRALVSGYLVDISTAISFDILGDSTASSYGLPLDYDRASGAGYSDHFAVKLKIDF